jgi:hypothetical protein
VNQLFFARQRKAKQKKLTGITREVNGDGVAVIIEAVNGIKSLVDKSSEQVLPKPVPLPPNQAASLMAPVLRQEIALQQNVEDPQPMKDGIVRAATSSTLKLLSSFVPADDSKYSDTAAKIEIKRLPASTINLDLRDIPIIGGMLSGTWVRVGKPERNKHAPEITIASPNDKFGAIRGFLEHGHLEFDLSGLLTTTLNLDVEPNQKGEANLRLTSNIIPKFSFGRNQESDWHRVTNMGDGGTYYFNSKTGETQYEEPEQF